MAYKCFDCPRNCGAIRDGSSGKGFCGGGELIDVAKVMRHMWEEPCIGGDKGVENVFLYGCNLKCVYCQNRKINGTSDDFDKSRLMRLDPPGFAELLVTSSQTDAASVGIVTGDHFIRQISKAVTEDIRSRISKPIVFNCGGYQKPDMLELLKDRVDIFMPDFKYVDKDLAGTLSRAKDYPSVCLRAIEKCFEITGPAVFGEDGLMKKGVLVRHLILPGHINNTLGVIDKLNETFRPGDIVFSLMSQYVPVSGFCPPPGFEKLSGGISKAEYKKAKAYLENASNITLGYTQDPASSSSGFIPDF